MKAGSIILRGRYTAGGRKISDRTPDLCRIALLKGYGHQMPIWMKI